MYVQYLSMQLPCQYMQALWNQFAYLTLLLYTCTFSYWSTLCQVIKTYLCTIISDELLKHIKITATTAVIFKVDRYIFVSVYFSGDSVRPADRPNVDFNFQSRQIHFRICLLHCATAVETVKSRQISNHICLLLARKELSGRLLWCGVIELCLGNAQVLQLTKYVCIHTSTQYLEDGHFFWCCGFLHHHISAQSKAVPQMIIMHLKE